MAGTGRELAGYDLARMRPGMYIGDLASGAGLHNLVVGACELAIRAARAGDCRELRVTLLPEDGLAIEWDAPIADYAQTTQISHNLHGGTGIGFAVAMCARSRCDIVRAGERTTHAHVRGVAVERAIATEPAGELARPEMAPNTSPAGDARRGGDRTRIEMVADPLIFARTAVAPVALAAQLAAWAQAIAGFTTVLVDARDPGEPPHESRFAGSSAVVLGDVAAELAALERAARAAPADAATSLVLGDALMAAGDPRGEIIAISHALASGAGGRAELEARALRLLERDRDRIWGRPGGFPHAAPWRGRTHLRATMMTQLPAPAYARACDLLAAISACTAPAFVTLPTPSPAAIAALEALGYARVTPQRPRWGRTSSSPPTAPLHAAIGAILEPLETYRLEYVFAIADRDGPLPFQHGAWYADGLALVSTLEIEPHHDAAGNNCFLSLALPFETVADPGCIALRAGAEAILGCRIDLA